MSTIVKFVYLLSQGIIDEIIFLTKGNSQTYNYNPLFYCPTNEQNEQQKYKDWLGLFYVFHFYIGNTVWKVIS